MAEKKREQDLTIEELLATLSRREYNQVKKLFEALRTENLLSFYQNNTRKTERYKQLRLATILKTFYLFDVSTVKQIAKIIKKIPFGVLYKLSDYTLQDLYDVFDTDEYSQIKQKTKQKTKQKVKQKMEQKMEQNLEQKTEQETEQKTKQKTEQETEQKTEQKIEQKIEQEIEQETEQIFEVKNKVEIKDKIFEDLLIVPLKHEHENVSTKFEGFNIENCLASFQILPKAAVSIVTRTTLQDLGLPLFKGAVEALKDLENENSNPCIEEFRRFIRGLPVSDEFLQTLHEQINKQKHK